MSNFKYIIIKGFFLVGLIAVSCTSNNQSSGKVTPYPHMEEATESTLYSVVVNRQSIWTEHYVSNLEIDKLPDWFSADYVREPQEMHIASFEGDGRLEFVITIAETPDKVVVKPASKGIIPEVDGNRISFTAHGPGQLVVEVDDLAPLYLFINPEEKQIPSPDEEGVIYFGPGLHEAGYIDMKDNETVYIAAGAIVYGGIRADSVTNIKVIGRGVLDGDYRYSQMVLMKNCHDVLFEGVTIRNSQHWTNTLVNCRDVEYHNVKVIGFGPSSDGINPAGSQRVKITDCFIRCTDDCIAIKAPNPLHPVQDITVENNIMIGFAYADGVTIGFETNAEFVRNIEVRDCDILLARGGSRVDGHSGFSIICDGPAVISHILFENIRVEQSEIKLFELHITDGTKYGEGPSGHISDITVRNVEWFHEGPVVLYGYDEAHIIDNVFFENCTVAGKPLLEVQDNILQKNEYVNNIFIR